MVFILGGIELGGGGVGPLIPTWLRLCLFFIYANRNLLKTMPFVIFLIFFTLCS